MNDYRRGNDRQQRDSDRPQQRDRDHQQQRNNDGGRNNKDDLSKVQFETSNEVDVTPTFDSMGLREDLLRGIYAYGEFNIHVCMTILI